MNSVRFLDVYLIRGLQSTNPRDLKNDVVRISQSPNNLVEACLM